MRRRKEKKSRKNTRLPGLQRSSKHTSLNAHTKFSLFPRCRTSRPPALKTCISDKSWKSVCCSVVESRCFVLYYTSFQLLFHCSREWSRGVLTGRKNFPILQAASWFSIRDVLHLLVEMTTTDRDSYSGKSKTYIINSILIV